MKIKLSKLNKLLEEGSKIFNPSELKGKDVVVMVGETGAGKSLTNHYIRGHEIDLRLRKVRDEYIEVYDVDKTAGLPEVGHEVGEESSKTLFPAEYDGYLDTAGYDENRGIEESIVASTYTSNAFKLVNSVKIMLCINYNSLNSGRAKSFVNLYKMLKDFFRDFIEINDSLMIVFTDSPVVHEVSGKQIKGKSPESFIKICIQGILKKIKKEAEKFKEQVEMFEERDLKRYESLLAAYQETKIELEKEHNVLRMLLGRIEDNAYVSLSAADLFGAEKREAILETLDRLKPIEDTSVFNFCEFNKDREKFVSETTEQAQQGLRNIRKAGGIKNKMNGKMKEIDQQKKGHDNNEKSIKELKNVLGNAKSKLDYVNAIERQKNTLRKNRQKYNKNLRENTNKIENLKGNIGEKTLELKCIEANESIECRWSDGPLATDKTWAEATTRIAESVFGKNQVVDWFKGFFGYMYEELGIEARHRFEMKYPFHCDHPIERVEIMRRNGQELALRRGEKYRELYDRGTAFREGKYEANYCSPYGMSPDIKASVFVKHKNLHTVRCLRENLQEEIDDLNAQVENLESASKRIKSCIKTTESDIRNLELPEDSTSGLEERIKQVQDQIERLEKRNNDISHTLPILHHELTTLKQEWLNLTHPIEDQLSTLDEILKIFSILPVETEAEKCFFETFAETYQKYRRENPIFVYKSDQLLGCVHLAGSFNRWLKNSAKNGDGTRFQWKMRQSTTDRNTWRLTTLLDEGEHAYKFVINRKEWKNDPEISRVDNDGNSLITVPLNDAIPLTFSRENPFPHSQSTSPRSNNRNLHSLGLGVVQQLDDGNCLFRSVAQPLDGADYNALRAQSVSYMQNNIEQFRAFIGTRDDEFLERVRTMAEDREWGDTYEIAALALLLNRPIVIIHRDIERNHLIFNLDGANEPIFLYYTFGLHYDSLIPQEGVNTWEILRRVIAEQKQFCQQHQYEVNAYDVNKARISAGVSVDEKDTSFLHTMFDILMREAIQLNIKENTVKDLQVKEKYGKLNKAGQQDLDRLEREVATTYRDYQSVKTQVILDAGLFVTTGSTSSDAGVTVSSAEITSSHG